LQHSENTYKGQELGENLFGCFGMEATGQEISDHWYSEIKKYNFNGDWQGGCGHFTQMVWNTTVLIGCGVKTNCRNMFGSNEHYAITCNYWPAGNWIGRKPWIEKQKGEKAAVCAAAAYIHPAVGIISAALVFAVALFF